MKNFTLLAAVLLCLCFISCQEDPTCFDGELNQDETAVDCGGICQPCTTTNCSDGIQNGDETGVDCGGSCDPCAQGCPSTFANSLSYEVNGSSASADIVSAMTSSNNLVIQVNTLTPPRLLSLTHDGASFIPDTYNVGGLTLLYFQDGGEEFQSIISGSTGTVTFTEFSTDSDCPYVSGSIDATIFSGQGNSVQITSTFSQLEY